MAQQMQSQAMMLDSQQEVDAQLLTGQISEAFGALDRIGKKIKSGRLSQKELTSENEVAVALLSMLGANCEDFTRERQRDVLMVGYAHFDELRRQLDKDAAYILKDWLSYMDAALLSKPLTKLQITRQTLERAEAYMTQGGGLSGFMGRFMGAKHDKEDEAQHARDNADDLRLKHRAAISGAKGKYSRRQKDGRRCPTQNEIYRVSGGSRRKEFAPALLSERKKVDAMRAMQVEGDGDSDSDVAADDAVDSCNAYIVNKPRGKKLKRNGKTLSIKYPYPCQVLERLSHSTFGVRLAAPLDDIDVEVAVNNLQRQPSEVGPVEQLHLANYGNLGYAPLRKYQRKHNHKHKAQYQ